MAYEEAAKAVNELVAELEGHHSPGHHSPGNPVSEKCERVLETTPKCYDFAGIRRWVMCRAWQEMEKRKIPFSEAIRISWSEARRVCSWE